MLRNQVIFLHQIQVPAEKLLKTFDEGEKGREEEGKGTGYSFPLLVGSTKNAPKRYPSA